jgi:hypothetical protein
MTQHQKIITQLIETEAYLAALGDKAPQPVLNETLGKLVEMVRPCHDCHFVSAILDHEIISKKLSSLHCNLSACEYALEKYWAARIIDQGYHYTDYPYIDSYCALVDAESDLLKKHSSLIEKSICFIGSGPMPITAFELKTKHPSVFLTCIEMETQAIALSEKICVRSGFSIHHIQDQAENTDYSDYDIIFVASMTINKKQVFERIAATAKPGALIAIRSVEKLRRILYSAVREQDIPNRFKYLEKTIYRPEQINTTLLYRLKN